jgi:hypothetical protein
MEEYVKQIIKDRAEQIRKEVAKGVLYGEPIDLNNPDMVLVAAVANEELKQLRFPHTYIPLKPE